MRRMLMVMMSHFGITQKAICCESVLLVCP